MYNVENRSKQYKVFLQRISTFTRTEKCEEVVQDEERAVRSKFLRQTYQLKFSNDFYVYKIHSNCPISTTL